jgi:hypothetical protein
MTITATRTPVTLTAANYIPFPLVIDPADGTVQTAFTAFRFVIPTHPPRTVGGRFALAETFAIQITPVAMITVGATMTAGLLAHEQFHYDVGFVIARRLAHVLTGLRRNSVADLAAALSTTVTLHFTTRAGLIQRRYDLDTRHGTNAHYQQIWLDRMRVCLADPSATQIGGFYL